MFSVSEKIKKEAQLIIADDNDNDILLIIAHKGIGKTELLEEIYGSTSFNPNLIVVSGKSVKINVCSLKKCFAEGIVEFASRNNNYSVRHKLNKYINTGFIQTIQTFANRKIPRKEYVYCHDEIQFSGK